MTKAEIKILGSGTSTGIPLVGCSCAVCRSSDPRDERLRSSIFLTTPKGKKILIDTSPDLRTQLLRAQIDQVDFVILTHEHADHLHGIDDLRPLSFHTGADIPLYTSEKVAALLELRYPYIFSPSPQVIGGGIPRIALQRVTEFMTKLEIEGEEFTFFMLPHGRTETMGFLYQTQTERFAYVIDCHEIPTPVLELLARPSLDYLIIDCVTNKVHQTHLWQERTFEYLEQIRPRRAGLIHMGHNLSHAALLSACQKRFTFSVAPLFDTQTITF